LGFEYDENKSIKNKEKHNIDFEEAKLLWNDKNSIVTPAKLVNEEERYSLISFLKTKCYLTIFVIRNNNYRIISVRRCRKNEEKDYEKNNI
jgi:uncharacterized DUF497 family protein